MITLISGTNRKHAMTQKVTHNYKNILLENNIEFQTIDLSKVLSDNFIVSALYDNIGKDETYNPIMEQIKISEKYIFIIPEYNGSFPGIFKVFIDSLELPACFRGKKCALVGLSSGRQGASIAMSHLTDIFNYLGMHVFAQKPKLSDIDNKINAEGLLDEKYSSILQNHATEFLKF